MMNASFASLYIGTLNNQQENHVSIMNSDTPFRDMTTTEVHTKTASSKFH
jgi:hypothetical protein